MEKSEKSSGLNNYITVFAAESQEDRRSAYQLRMMGYRKYFTHDEMAIEPFDSQKNCTLLLALSGNGIPLGTMRIMDRRHGGLEIDKYLDLDAILGGNSHSVAEATRLSVPSSPSSRLVKLLLWKAFFEYCETHHVERMVVWAKRSASKDYRRLLFESLGASGIFNHPLLGGLSHESFVTDLRDVRERFLAAGHPLHDFMFVEKHQILVTK